MRTLSRAYAAADTLSYDSPRSQRAISRRRPWSQAEPAWLEVTSSKWLMLCLALLAVVGYLNALSAGFTFDDEPQIRDNPAVMLGVDPILALATPLPPGDLYRPATVFTFAVNEALTPGAPAAFHAVNIVLHALVTLLVFGLAVRLFGSVRLGAIAAALFALHPIHTEAVTSLVGRAEVMSALFGLLAILTATPDDGAVHAPPRSALPPAAVRAVSLSAFSLALLSKESALTMLPLLLLYRVTLRDEPMVRGLWCELRSGYWVPYGLCAAAFLGLRSYVITALAPPTPVIPLNNILAFVPWTVRIPSALGVLWDYFGLLNVPLVLSADYSYSQVPVVQSWLAPRALGGMALIAAATAVAVHHRQAAIRFAAAFPIVALSVTSNLLFPIGTIKAERLLYLPSVGWALLVAWGVEEMLRRPRFRAAGLGIVLVVAAAFGARTWSRNQDWQDNEVLYRSMVRAAPDSAKSRYNFGIALQHRHADEFAVPQLRRALDIYPRWADIALGLGIAYQRSSRVDEAVEWYSRALVMNPEFGSAHTNLCYVLNYHARFAEAGDACRQGLRYNPTDANLLKGLGTSLMGLGEMDKGLAVLRRSLVENPSDGPLRRYLEQVESAIAEDEQQKGALQ